MQASSAPFLSWCVAFKEGDGAQAERFADKAVEKDKYNPYGNVLCCSAFSHTMCVNVLLMCV